jgi:glycosyltransferase involved in cell wall biosynthesis
MVTKTRIEGFECYDIRHPQEGRSFPDYIVSPESVRWLIDQCGAGDIAAIIAYNYPPIALHRLINLAQRLRIKIVLDCTEWHAAYQPSLPNTIIRYVLTQYRMRWLPWKAGNVIVANRYLQSRYRGCNTLVLPMVVDPDTPKWRAVRSSSRNDPRRFVYAGSPGARMRKDCLQLVVQAFASAKRCGSEFVFTIVGITASQFLEGFPLLESDLRVLDGSIAFLGRVPHRAAIQQIGQSDFSVFLRPLNRVTQSGFPMKVAEAFACGIPTIANNTSDLGVHIHDGENGFLLEAPDPHELQRVIEKALALTAEELEAMKASCISENPFSPDKFRTAFGEFLERARRPCRRRQQIPRLLEALVTPVLSK